VPRNQFASIAAEHKAAVAAFDATDSLDVGRLIGADCLVRLGSTQIRASQMDYSSRVELVRSTHARFPTEVQSLAPVSDFISRA
jgi:hypothetical protein